MRPTLAVTMSARVWPRGRAKDMRYTRAAIIYSQDAYGEAYKESLVSHCERTGVEVDAYNYEVGDTVSIKSQAMEE